MAYEVVMSYHLHMPSYFLGTFTEYPYVTSLVERRNKEKQDYYKKIEQEPAKSAP